WEAAPRADRFDAPAPGAVADAGVSASGRRRLREPWDESGGLNGAGVRRRLEEPTGPRDPGVAAADTGVSASGRRRLRESWDGADPAAANTGVSATGRRRLREPWDAVDAGPTGSVADSGVSASGRRRLREPWEPGPDGLNG